MAQALLGPWGGELPHMDRGLRIIEWPAEPFVRTVRTPQLLDQRQAAGAARLRHRRRHPDQLRQAGWLVRDTPDGPELQPAPPYETVDPAALEPRWEAPDRHDVSVVVHVAGWPEDVARATRALAAHKATSATRCCWSPTAPERPPAGTWRTWPVRTSGSRSCTSTRPPASARP